MRRWSVTERNFDDFRFLVLTFLLTSMNSCIRFFWTSQLHQKFNRVIKILAKLKQLNLCTSNSKASHFLSKCPQFWVEDTIWFAGKFLQLSKKFFLKDGLKGLNVFVPLGFFLLVLESFWPIICFPCTGRFHFFLSFQRHGLSISWGYIVFRDEENQLKLSKNFGN